MCALPGSRGRAEEAKETFIPLFEALNWAVSFEDLVRKQQGAPRNDDLVLAIRYARNRVHHQWAAALNAVEQRFGLSALRADLRSSGPTSSGSGSDLKSCRTPLARVQTGRVRRPTPSDWRTGRCVPHFANSRTSSTSTSESHRRSVARAVWPNSLWPVSSAAYGSLVGATETVAELALPALRAEDLKLTNAI